MAKLTKKQKAFEGKVDSTKLYPLGEALAIVKDCANAKFDESIDVAIQLGVDAKKSDQVVRGAVGESGANPDYVLNTVAHLREMGIHDSMLEALVARLQA